MAKGVNKGILIGTLGNDPEIRHTASGSVVANLSVATNETWRDKQSGEKQERTEWHKIVIFGKLAEIAGEYLKKGSQAYFEGRIQTRKWQDQSGNDRYSTEIVANEMQMLGGQAHIDNRGDYPDKQTATQPADYPKDKEGTGAAASGGDGFDDIPF